MSKSRNSYSPEQKVKILKEHLVIRCEISDICNEYSIHPNIFYFPQWNIYYFFVCLILFSLLILIQTNIAHAGSLRYDGELITKGDTTYEVSSICGQPDHKEIHYEERYHEKVKKIVKIETWTYNFGTNRFIYYLTFENGKLVDIQTGDYGFPKKSNNHN